MIKSKNIKSLGISLHCLDSCKYNDRYPLLYIPGVSGTAEEGRFLIEEYKERRCVSVSMRGRGNSDTPQDGYSIDSHAYDLEQIVRHLNFERGRYHLHTYSIAAMYGLSFILKTDVLPASFIVGDHPARVSKLPDGWAEQFAALKISGKAVTDNIRRSALHGIESSSKDVDLYDDLKRKDLDIPVLLLRGGNRQHPPSPMSDDDLDRYKQAFSNIQVEFFHENGHFLRDFSRERYLKVIYDFMERHDV